MAKIWYAGPKKGRANFLNVIRVSGEGVWIDVVCLVLPIFLSLQAEDHFFPEASGITGLLYYLLVFFSAFTLLRLIAVAVFRKHIDFDNPHTSYRDGVFVADAERI